MDNYFRSSKVTYLLLNVNMSSKCMHSIFQFGVSSIFGPDAELTGISTKAGLFVQELVQNVAVRVDNTDASTSLVGGNYLVKFKFSNHFLFTTSFAYFTFC